MSELERVLNATAYLARKSKYREMQSIKRCLITGGVLISMFMTILLLII